MNTKSLSLNWKAAKVNLGVVAIAITIHGLLLLTFGDEYRTALYSFSSTIISLLRSSWTLVAAFSRWCFVFTGWFFFPLAYCLWVSLSTLYIFAKAIVQNKSLPMLECGKLLYGDANSDGALFLGGILAVFIGMSGTLVYIMWGLHLMGESMGDMANIVSSSSSAGGNMVGHLPFGKLAEAAHKIVPALGTTMAAVFSKEIVKYAERRAFRWHPNIGSTYPWAPGRLDYQQLARRMAKAVGHSGSVKQEGDQRHANRNG